MHLPRKRDVLPPVPKVRTRLSREDGTFDVESDSVELVARSAPTVPSDAPMALDAAPVPDPTPSVAPPPARRFRRRRTWSSTGAIALAALVGVLSGQRIRSALLSESPTAAPAAPAPPRAHDEEAAPSVRAIAFDEPSAPAEAEPGAEPVDDTRDAATTATPILEPPIATAPTESTESRTPPFLNYGRTLHRR